MSSEQSGFLLLMFLALFLMIIGVQGQLGTSIAILFCPAYVELQE
jgi:hypothetical protein